MLQKLAQNLRGVERDKVKRKGSQKREEGKRSQNRRDH